MPSLELLLACLGIVAAANAHFCGNFNYTILHRRSRKGFHLSKSKMDFFEASQYCMKLGMQMATILNDKERLKAEAVIYLKGVVTEGVWIGGMNFGKGDKSKVYYWHATGKVMEFSNWDKNQPDNRNLPNSDYPGGTETEHCVYIQNLVDYKYKWGDGLCSEPLFVLCDDSCDYNSGCVLSSMCDDFQQGGFSEADKPEIPLQCRTGNWTHGKVLDAKMCDCLSAVDKMGSNHNRFKIPPLRLNWWEARNWCMKYNMSLAEITSEDEQFEIEDFVQETRDQLWVSGTDWGQTHFWYWATTGRDLTKFDGEDEATRRFWKLQNGSAVVEHCLFLDVLDEYNWVDADCLSKKYFVCQNKCGDIHTCYCEDL